jgi:uncharacterized integral membrane protein
MIVALTVATVAPLVVVVVVLSALPLSVALVVGAVIGAPLAFALRRTRAARHRAALRARERVNGRGAPPGAKT